MPIGIALILLIVFIATLALLGVGLFLKGASLIGGDKDGYALCIIGWILMMLALLVAIVFWP